MSGTWSETTRGVGGNIEGNARGNALSLRVSGIISATLGVSTNANQQSISIQAPGTEMQHVAIHRDTYRGFNASASDYVGQCFSKAKAQCWRSVINGSLKDAWLAHNHTANLTVLGLARRAKDPQLDPLAQTRPEIDPLPKSLSD